MMAGSGQGGCVDDPITQKSTSTSTHQHKRADSTKTQQCDKPKSKRPICQGCNFPPMTCICPSLPAQPLYPLFQRCRIVILQHPHELRKKNRSLPLVDLCLFGKSQKDDQNNDAQEDIPISQGTAVLSNITKDDQNDTKDMLAQGRTDFVMKTIVMRRFGEYTDPNVMQILHDPNEVIVLVFPHKDALDLEEGIRLAEERCGFINDAEKKNESHDSGQTKTIDTKDDAPQIPKNKKMTLIFIDATWKHAREMEAASSVEWPENLIRVQLKPSGSNSSKVSGQRNHDEGDNAKAEISTSEGPNFIERRFQIRTPPSPDHLSTAECLAWIASRVEHNPDIYQGIMKTLDYMVKTWEQFTEKSTSDNRKSKRNVRSKNMSQKKLKIGER